MLKPANSNPYVGRFAPSPSGPLHFGSLVSALASYLDARQAKGKWLVRMEDIDPPRQPVGTDAIILRQLEQHSLCWDGDILFQSTRLDAYKEALETLKQQTVLFPCICTRDQIKAQGGLHPKPCRDVNRLPEQPFAWRVSVQHAGEIHFSDLFRGDQRQQLIKQGGDFVLKRKDGLFAYQLAVVVDEAYQNITHIVRGGDLLDSTFRQIFLQQLLGFTTPAYGHIPIAVDNYGVKLSKQTGAMSLDEHLPADNIARALHWLGFELPCDLRGADCEELLAWAVAQWQLSQIALLTPEKPALQ